MTRFDKLYEQTHPRTEETEKIIKVESAVEDFVEDVETEAEEQETEKQEGEEVDAGSGNAD